MKFKDAELIGVPTIVTVGRGLANGTIEVRDRATDERQEIAVGEAVAHIEAIVVSVVEARIVHAIEAVIFDWGGTLTRWHDVDFHAESLALAAAVKQVQGHTAIEPVETHAAKLLAAGSVVWGRSRDHQRSATIADLFTEAGLDHDPELLTAYYEFWEPHTDTDPEVRPMWEELKAMGLRVGVLSNTVWPREWHEGFFRRDGVLDLVDGDVYTSEIPWTKPSPEAFRAAARRRWA